MQRSTLKIGETTRLNDIHKAKNFIKHLHHRLLIFAFI